jgi:hypothetical protein
VRLRAFGILRKIISAATFEFVILNFLCHFVFFLATYLECEV